VFGFLGIAAAAFTVQSVLRARGEESSGRLEPLLATAVSRTRWLASHVVIAVAGTVGLLTAAGLAAGLAFGALTGQWAQGVSWFLGAALVQVPPALALGALVVAAIGLVPRAATAIGWSAVVLGLVMGQLGALFELPQSVLNLSPFTHTPLVPAAPFAVLPVAVLLTVAGALGVVGFVRLARRDLVAAA
jgi:ABC-2 type transport system permease protein